MGAPSAHLIETQTKSYVPVPADLFSSDSALDFSLYARAPGRKIVQICPAGEAPSSATLKRWLQGDRRVFYVDTAEIRHYQRYAERSLDTLLDRPELSTQRKAELCYTTTRELIRDAVQESNVDDFVGEQRERWVGNVVTLICEDPAAIEGMISMLSHDYYTYTHMVNVSVMASALAYRLGEHDPKRLRTITSGGLLHDVGKMQVNPETLNKQGRLTAEEWEQLKAHPVLGLDMLHNRKDIGPAERLMVQQHHEKLDGSGYPSGLLGSEIATEAQLTAVVDIYDALTCKRAYREAMPHAKAMAILREESQAKINPDMARLWEETAHRAANAEEQA